MGGTKTDVAVGTCPDDLTEPHRIPTTDPDTTLEAITRYFTDHPVDTVGVASFGPLNLDPDSTSFGSILSTPKPGWSGVSVHQRLRNGIGVPVAIDTDVNGAALGEGRWGAAHGMSNHIYVTVGTGIGAGVVVNGETISGGRHPEAGHVVVSRLAGDDHTSTCPYHSTCLEGMAAGPALEARFGNPDTWSHDSRVLDLAVHYLAQGVIALVYVAAPERIVVGGGVSGLPGFHERLRDRVGQLLGGYPQANTDLDLLISPAGLGRLSGLAGALVLAGSGGH